MKAPMSSFLNLFLPSLLSSCHFPFSPFLPVAARYAHFMQRKHKDKDNDTEAILSQLKDHEQDDGGEDSAGCGVPLAPLEMCLCILLLLLLLWRWFFLFPFLFFFFFFLGGGAGRG